METPDELAPPVVAVVVVHEPAAWFSEVLAGLAAQDYSNLRHLFLVVGELGDLPAQIAAALPNAFVRAVETNRGYGPTANEVMRLVEGDNGFFCLLHDDVALEPDAIRLLVEELYRSNAGIVGPKLVDWNEPVVLQHVGLAVDRFGEIDPVIEPGEADQEQHDAVRDVFALPSACLLVRADLFRSLGGFDDSIDFHGDGLDLCWRTHLGGARVIVVPSARARHLGRLAERRPDLAHVSLSERHRIDTVTTLTGARRLPLVLLQLVALTLGQLVVGVFTGGAARAWAAWRALVSQVGRIPALVRRRREVSAGRLVPDREIVGLQMRGSARLSTYLRSRDVRTDSREAVRPWRERAGAGSALAWLAIVGTVLVGSRHLLTDGVPPVGEFLPFADSPAQMLRSYLSAWNAQGLGTRSAMPTGVGLIGVASAATLFRMGLLHTLSIVGLLVVGALGMWRLSRAYSSTRSRLVATVVYLVVPLPAQLLSMGRWGALAVYAALPWSIDAMRRAAGLEAMVGDTGDEQALGVPARRLVRAVAAGGFVAAVATALEPAYVLVLVAVAVVLAAATLLSGAGTRAALVFGGVGVCSAAVGWLLNLPWSWGIFGSEGWAGVVGPPPNGSRGLSTFDLLTFDVGSARGAAISIALYLPVVAAILIGRGGRFGWAVRSGALVVVFAWFAVLDDGGQMPFQLPEPGIVLVPVAVGLALAAGCVVAAFELDVRGGDFGWRQPLSLIGAIAIVLGAVPGIFAVQTGRWNLPETTMVDLLSLRSNAEGDYRVLWIGDQRVLPVVGRPVGPGVAYAITTNRTLEVDETWRGRASEGDDDIAAALAALASGSTTRVGRLLAPFGVRYVVVPVADGAVSTSTDPLPLPAGLLDAIGDQLDLAEEYSPPNFVAFENRAWIPLRSVLTASGAEASKSAGASARARSDASGAAPIMIGADHLRPASAAVPAGTVHLGLPLDAGWSLRLGDQEVDRRPAFGITTAFDLDAAGTATIGFDNPASRRLVVLVQVMAWMLVLAVALGARLPRRPERVLTTNGDVEPVLTLDPVLHRAAPAAVDEPVGGEAEVDGAPIAADAEAEDPVVEDPVAADPVSDDPVAADLVSDDPVAADLFAEGRHDLVDDAGDGLADDGEPDDEVRS